MGKTKKLADLVNVVTYDANKNVTLPKSLTLGEAPLITDDSLAVPTTSWVNDKLDGKEPLITAGTIAQYWRGDKSWQTLNTSVVPESGNLYYTNARTIASVLTGYTSGAGTISATDSILTAIQKLNGNISGLTTGVSSVNGLTGAVSLSTTNISEGTNLYYTNARVSANTDVAANTAARHNAVTIGTANGLSLSTQQLSLGLASSSANGALSSSDFTTFNNKQNALNGTGFVKISGTTISYDNSTYLTTISGITAGGELSGSYPNPTLVNSAVTSKLLSGVNITGGSISATDSILTAFGKIQNQINGLIGSTIYQGTWNASTNTPTLASSVGTKGQYYIVSVDGSTNLNGVTDWKLGDWAIYDGTAWQKVDNTDAVVSVNGFTGAVSLTTSNITEGTNLYYTNSRTIASTLTGYTSGTGTISATDTVLSAIQKLNGNIGALTTTNITEGTRLYYTDARARAAISLTTTGNSGASTYNSSTGVLNVPTYTLAGLGGQPLLTNPITGSGTTNYLSKFTASGAIGNSLVYDNGTNVGIGTTSPVANLHINGVCGAGSSGSLSLAAPASGGGCPSYLIMGNNDSIGVAGPNVIVSLNRNLIFGFGNSFSSSSGGTITETMRIDNNGNVGIGTTSPSSRLTVAGDIEVTSTSNTIFTNIISVVSSGADMVLNSSSASMIFNAAGAERMRINTGTGNVGIGTNAPSERLQVNGNVLASGFFQSSDERLKNIISIDGDMITYKWKDGRDDKLHYGYSAQQTQKINSNLVSKGADNMLAINYTERLVLKVRELEKQVELLKAQIN